MYYYLFVIYIDLQAKNPAEAGLKWSGVRESNSQQQIGNL
ncbi:hypothetical protein UFOVP240_67 [uncultured Caudovirales phage]|uniref:Uncharacterized protein n=1 Tax=uncultured Caudovirales phage TaxID=2100421 RepID=A0A6J7WTE6_9CAUD|nr:hypothetical protein UFOVP240_67 [uncultured Caudovirales phage]